MKDKLKIKVILGSNREGRQGAKVAKWVTSVAVARPELDVETIDLAESDLPFAIKGTPPAMRKPGEYPDEKVAAWGKKIAEADGFILVATEYNYGYTAILKNALDHLYVEWSKKPVAFVGYSASMTGGTRAIEQLVSVTTHLGMAQALPSTHVMGVYGFDPATTDMAHLNSALGSTVDSLTWWAGSLKTARLAG